MKELKLFVLLFLAFGNLFGQTSADSTAFPQSWIGDWKGELEIYTTQGKVQSVPMQVNIHPTEEEGTYAWTLVYGAGLDEDRRPYLLKTVDASKGRYVIDEKNSIVLESYLFANKLLSRFQVGNTMLLATYEMKGGTLHFGIVSGGLEPASKTGGTEIEGEEIPEVAAYSIGVMQRAVLTQTP